MPFSSTKTLIAAALVAAAPLAQAQLSFGSSGGNVSVTVLSDISFVATGTETAFLRFVFENAYSSAPGTTTFGTQSNSIGLSVNGAPVAGLGTTSLWGSFASNLGEIDPDDFTISFSGNAGFAIGDTVTLTAGTAVTNLSDTFLPNLMVATAIMTGNSGNAISAPVMLSPVPEPATVALTLLGLGIVGAAAARRRG